MTQIFRTISVLSLRSPTNRWSSCFYLQTGNRSAGIPGMIIGTKSGTLVWCVLLLFGDGSSFSASGPSYWGCCHKVESWLQRNIKLPLRFTKLLLQVDNTRNKQTTEMKYLSIVYLAQVNTKDGFKLCGYVILYCWIQVVSWFLLISFWNSWWE